jgi:hypothetical protein
MDWEEGVRRILTLALLRSGTGLRRIWRALWAIGAEDEAAAGCVGGADEEEASDCSK